MATDLWNPTSALNLFLYFSSASNFKITEISMKNKFQRVFQELPGQYKRMNSYRVRKKFYNLNFFHCCLLRVYSSWLTLHSQLTFL